MLLAATAIGLLLRPPAAADIDFDRDIRPILADSCFTCHGPDPLKRKARLRLDLKDGLFQATGDAQDPDRAPGSPDLIVAPGRPGASELIRRVLSTDPFDRGLLYVTTAIGTTLMVISVIGWLAERTRATAATQVLADTGRTTLTLYVGHVLVFDLVVDWLGWVEPGGLGTALTLALVYWVLAVAVSVEIHRRFRTGPLEWAYRKFSA